VVIDYAHTPDALQRCLQQAVELAQGARLFVVFGCGGERDSGKRAEMGAIAARLAHSVWITNDNPRREDPRAIAAQIEEGALSARGADGAAQIHVCLERRQAIENALRDASPRDVVVIAGKGHERVQSIGGENVPFSDADVAREAAALIAVQR
jgi:UDP-N-acetylmuramoyl-L-alanyl-D-glutamate--2,6-diaminopimelate ligase